MIHGGRHGISDRIAAAILAETAVRECPRGNEAIMGSIKRADLKGDAHNPMELNSERRPRLIPHDRIRLFDFW